MLSWRADPEQVLAHGQPVGPQSVPSPQLVGIPQEALQLSLAYSDHDNTDSDLVDVMEKCVEAEYKFVC